jgi:LacI family transcriptional regulator
MGYQPNAIVRGLGSNYTKTIGLIIPDITNPFFPAMAMGVEDAASKLGYNLFLCNTNWDKNQEQIYITALHEKRVDGIIIHSVNDTGDDGKDTLNNINIPFVLLNRQHEGNVSTIGVDNFNGGFLAAKHLIELGYKKIAFIGGKQGAYSNIKRLEGYKKALKHYEYLIDETHIVHGDFKTESGYELTHKLLKAENPPDAIFAGNDIIALGVLQCVQEYGYNVPQDFGIIGFDNIPFAELPQIQLSTIDQPKYHIGKTAFEILIEQLKSGDGKAYKKIVLEPELIIRKTTGKMALAPRTCSPSGN